MKLPWVKHRKTVNSSIVEADKHLEILASQRVHVENLAGKLDNEANANNFRLRVQKAFGGN